MPPRASLVTKNSRLWKRHEGLSEGFLGVAVLGCGVAREYMGKSLE